MNTIRLFISIALLLFFATMNADAQQLADMEYHYEIKSPAFEKDSGPRLVIDAAHSPYIRRGSFDPFLRLVREDGFHAEYLESKINKVTLENVQVMVIANSYRKDFAQYPLMSPPSAYETDEITAIRDWVAGGGRLLLIADHAPFSGGTMKLAEAFGYTFFNGYMFEEALLPFRSGDIKYQTSGGLNASSPIISGNFVEEKIDRFQTFTGTVFIPPINANQVFTVPDGYVALMTQSLRRELETAQRINVSGLSQGSTMILGKGRLAVFAEAASFTALIINKRKLNGMNNPRADQNPLFILATMRWLAEGLQTIN